MPDRSISISARKENTREKNEIVPVAVHFELDEIKQHFNDSVSDINRQFQIADELILANKTDEAMDIWRSQIVFLEGILDFYLHELSKFALVSMFTGKWEKTKQYSNFPIPMITVEEGLKNPESTKWLLDRLSYRFSTETYISPDPMSQQLSLLGMSLTEICNKSLPKKGEPGYEDGKKHLGSLFKRRNQIAHQADKRHTDAQKDSIDKQYVENEIKFVSLIVEAIHNEALSKIQ